jgi:hypothetical protein
MAVSGNIRNREYRELVQHYEFEKLKRWTRRSITPTDIDGRYYIHSRVLDHFLFFELQTEGKQTSPYQDEAITALCRNGCGKHCFLIVEHKPLQPTKIPEDIIRFQIRMYDRVAKDVVTSPWQDGGENAVGWWVSEWFKLAEDEPNDFVTAFRQICGIYPPSKGKWRERRDSFSLEQPQ